MNNEIIYTLGQTCEGFFGPCGEPAIEISCRTQYPDEDMNKNPILCSRCAHYYNLHWDEMWNEYYSGLL